MNTKHALGPWKIEQGSNGDAVITHSDTELRSHVARIYAATLCPEHGTVEANARLIAAAPELLELAQLVMKWDSGELAGHIPIPVKVAAAARAAIAKATGTP